MTEAQKFALTSSNTLFGQMPVRASAFQSGRFHLRSATVQVEFTQSFTQKPKLLVWAMQPNTSGLPKLPPDCITSTTKNFTVTLNDTQLAEFKGCAASWVAYVVAVPAQHALLSDTIKLIMAHPPSLSTTLEQKVKECIRSLGESGTAADGQSLLHAAAYAGNNDLIELLLGQQANIDLQDERGWTPLMSSINPGHFEAASLLLQRGAQAGLVNNRKHTALHLFARADLSHPLTIETLRLLLSAGVDPNVVCATGETALMYACANRMSADLRVFDMLLEAGSDPTIGNTYGVTPLYLATQSNNFPLVNLLLQFGADPRKGPEGDTPLDKARDMPEILTLFDNWFTGGVKRRTPHLHAGEAPVTDRFLQRFRSMTAPKSADLRVAIRTLAHGTAAVAIKPLDASAAPRLKLVIDTPECADLCTAVNRICDTLTHVRHTLDEEGDVLRRFFEEAQTLMCQNPLWRSCGADAFAGAAEELREVVFGRLYSSLFDKAELRERDATLQRRFARLQARAPTPREWGVHITLDAGMQAAAERDLCAVHDEHTPRGKLRRMLDACRTLVAMLKGAGLAAAADDFLPLFLFLVVRANVPRLHSSLSFIDRFAEASDRTGQAFCFFTHLVCAAAYVEDQEADLPVAGTPPLPTS
eukprot:TRINITY_DN1923_c0_g3_i1.p1 TRINITY_DN1923_c0_g3~~TRINITY_DN1923_c0_g3_i1.p1  ORF type:complete len:644 (-),score=167.91 TRINITY_DN1923_c0_g3_i1:51-1982(-)